MAPKKTTQSVAVAPKASSAADFFTRGKKPTTTDRVIANKQPLLKSTPAQAPNPQQQLQQQDTTRTVIVIEDSDDEDEDEDETDKTSAISARRDNDDNDWQGLDFVPLDDMFSDDNVKNNSNSIGLQPVLKTAAQTIMPLPRLVSKSSSANRSYSQPGVTPIDIKKGIHQNDISKHEKILRQFDLSSKYGPCLDLTRLERWERALQLGLSPPKDVKDLLVAHTNLNTPIFAGRV
ncbi:hypothetical protein BGX29_005169 [Mortierella sp. GBA35]|nr:hypothetical protein BGX29_005169 [Mortierella sp. GBA35]